MKAYKILCWLILVVGACECVAAPTPSGFGQTLLEIRNRGYVVCGVSQGLAGFSSIDDKGRWQGLDVDFGRAVATAVFGDSKKVKFVPLSAKERFTALQSGEVDLLSRNTTWTYLRDTTMGLNFVGVLYYDGQGLMVRKSANIHNTADLKGAIVCTQAGTTTELNIADYFQQHHIPYKLVTFEKVDETLAAYLAGRCDVYSTDSSGLAAQRVGLPNKDDHLILPFLISKEPLSPMVRQGDDQWMQIVRWTLFSMINAEELDVNQQNVDQKAQNSLDPNVQRLLGVQGDFGEKLTLSNDCFLQVIKQVGNYRDIFEKNVGQMSPMQLPRGLNALWNEGGILYAPPLR